jgi:hypothetical protein
MASKNGGGTSTVVSDLPDYARDYMKDILATGKEEYITPYVGYGGERIAPESTQRRLVSEGIESLVQTGSPYYGEAMDLTRGAIRQSQVSFGVYNRSRTALHEPVPRAIVRSSKGGGDL